MLPHFRVPLNLPHAGTIVARIAHTLPRRMQYREVTTPRAEVLLAAVEALQHLLAPSLVTRDNPPEPRSTETRAEAARLARILVTEIERLHLGEDRLGQCIRNLFECLELGEEGAALSLRAGENPNSAQRPA